MGIAFPAEPLVSVGGTRHSYPGKRFTGLGGPLVVPEKPVSPDIEGCSHCNAGSNLNGTGRRERLETPPLPEAHLVSYLILGKAREPAGCDNTKIHIFMQVIELLVIQRNNHIPRCSLERIDHTQVIEIIAGDFIHT